MGRFSANSTGNHLIFCPVRGNICGAPALDDSVIHAIHDAPGKFVIATTGGGSTASAALLAVSGASRTIMESTVPYDPASLAAYIGGTPDQACSGKTARAMAMAAFQRARRYEPDERISFGIGATAALATDRERRGADRCFVALQSVDETREYELALSRRSRDRAQQEAACSELILAIIADACRIETAWPVLRADESLEERRQLAEPQWRRLFSGEQQCTAHGIATPRAIFPGAFNPLHDGHREMARIAAARTGEPVLLEISAFNVDKPALDYIEMARRRDGLRGEFPLTFTNAPTFTSKSALFPGATFVVGADTLERIGQPRYYHDSHELRDIAIQSIADQSVRFLVFGRTVASRFVGLGDIDIPEALRVISDGVPQSEFHVDVSSTAVRLGE